MDALIEALINLQVFGARPEGAFLRRVHPHARVVAPADQVSRLGAVAIDDRRNGFPRPQRIARNLARELDAGRHVRYWRVVQRLVAASVAVRLCLSRSRRAKRDSIQF